jgi:FkbM family methyltransferase
MLSSEEIKSVNRIIPFFSELPTVIDVGSNKGHWADLILTHFEENCLLHLFEPNEILLNFTKIKYEYNRNVTYNDSVAHHTDNELIPFYYFENYNNELSSIYKDEWDGLPMKEKMCGTITIDNYCSLKGIDYVDCIKIDAEGADVDVFNGCMKLLMNDGIGFLIMEYSHHYKRAGRNFKNVYDLVTTLGYSVYEFVDDNFEMVNSFNEDFSERNFIITKRNVRNHSVGWNREFIRNTAELGKFNFILEIGTFEGLTAKYICENLLQDGGRMICVDPLENYYTADDTGHTHLFKDQHWRFLANTAGLPIQLVRKDSSVALPEMHEFRFDLIYIDGRHDEDGVYEDAVNSFPITKNDGYILFDDYLWRAETERGIDKFLNEYADRIEVIVKEYQVLIKKITD